MIIQRLSRLKMRLSRRFRSRASGLAGLGTQASGTVREHLDSFRDLPSKKENVLAITPIESPESDLAPPNSLPYQTVVAHISPGSNVVVHSDPRSVAADRYRLLQTRLEGIQASRGTKRLLITSPLPEDGKSTVALNLAAGIAMRRKRQVLLLEADVYRPFLFAKLGLDPWPGLVDCYRNKSDPATAVRRIEPLGFHLLPAGRPFENAESLLPSGLVGGLLERLSPDFDWILIDSPPVLPVTQVLALKTQADATLLVVRAGKTQREAVEEAIQILGRDHIVGIVLNGVEGFDRAYSHFYGYGYEAAQSKSYVQLQALRENAAVGWRFAQKAVAGLEEAGKRYAREANAKWALKRAQESTPPLKQNAVPLEDLIAVIPTAREHAEPETQEHELLEKREEVLARLRMRTYPELPPEEPQTRFPLPRVGNAFDHAPPRRSYLVLTGMLLLALLGSFGAWMYLGRHPAGTPPASAQPLAAKPPARVRKNRPKVGNPVMQSTRKQTPAAASPAPWPPAQAREEIPISVQGAYIPCTMSPASKALGGEKKTGGPGTQLDRATCREEIGKLNPQSEYPSVINLTFH